MFTTKHNVTVMYSVRVQLVQCYIIKQNRQLQNWKSRWFCIPGT